MRKLREGYEARPDNCDLCHKKVHAKRLCMGHYLKVWRKDKPAATKNKNLANVKDAKPGELWALAKEMNLV